MPPMDSYVAKCDASADGENRDFVAIVQCVPGSGQFLLKVLSKSGNVIYEKELNQMLESWHLGSERLVFQEDLSSNVITYVRLYTDQEPAVYHFTLPRELTIKRQTVANNELYIQMHPCEDKDALRNFINQKVGEKAPEDFLMTFVDLRLVIVAEQEVVFFKPDSLLEECKSENLQLNRSELSNLHGWPRDHKVIGLIKHQ